MINPDWRKDYSKGGAGDNGGRKGREGFGHNTNNSGSYGYEQFTKVNGWTDCTIIGSDDDFTLWSKTFNDTNGKNIETKYCLELKSGAKAVLSSYGATIVSIYQPDSEGVIKDVVLGFDTRAEYDNP